MQAPIQVVAAIFTREVSGVTEVLICQRREDQSFAGQWEFPGGKVEAGESLVAALARELEEELGVRTEIGRRVAAVRHAYADGKSVELHFHLVDRLEGELANRIFQQILWCPLSELRKYTFLEADRGIVQRLAIGELL